jgi:hypothetical protein
MAASCIVPCARARPRFFYGNDIRHTILEKS